MTNWPVFIISLHDAQCRRQKLCARLDELSITYQIVPAVDGRTGLPSMYEPLVDRATARQRMKRDMSDGELACALSHQMVYNRIVKNDLLGAIVLEDDAEISEEFREFYFECHYTKNQLTLLDHNKAKVWVFSKRKLFKDIYTHRVSNNPFAATGYSISYSGAKYILENSTPVAATADWPCNLWKIDSVLTIPRLVDQPKGDERISTLHDVRQSLKILAREYQSNDLRKQHFTIKKWDRFFTRLYWRDWLRRRLSRRVDYSTSSRECFWRLKA